MPISQAYINDQPVKKRPNRTLEEAQRDLVQSRQDQQALDEAERKRASAAKEEEYANEVAYYEQLAQLEAMEQTEVAAIVSEIAAHEAEAEAIRQESSEVLTILTKHIERQRAHQSRIIETEKRLIRIKNQIAALKGIFPEVKNDWYRLVAGTNLQTVSVNADDPLSKVVVEELNSKVIYTGPDAIIEVIRIVETYGYGSSRQHQPDHVENIRGSGYNPYAHLFKKQQA